jgi:hypothetical protein
VRSLVRSLTALAAVALIAFPAERTRRSELEKGRIVPVSEIRWRAERLGSDSRATLDSAISDGFRFRVS